MAGGLGWPRNGKDSGEDLDGPATPHPLETSTGQDWSAPLGRSAPPPGQGAAVEGTAAIDDEGNSMPDIAQVDVRTDAAPVPQPAGASDRDAADAYAYNRYAPPPATALLTGPPSSSANGHTSAHVATRDVRPPAQPSDHYALDHAEPTPDQAAQIVTRAATPEPELPPEPVDLPADDPEANSTERPHGDDPALRPGSGSEAEADAQGISVTVARPWVDPDATPPAIPTVKGDGPNPFVESISIMDDSTPLALEIAEETRRRIALAGRRFPRPKDTRVVTISNQKGGVGKTTTTVNLAAALAQAGLRVLVVDNDPQGNASTALGIEHHSEVPSTYDVLVEGEPLADVIQACPDIENLWCAPATIDLAGAEIELVSLVARESRLQRAIATYLEDQKKLGNEPLDYILIDCPPSLGLLTVNAFVAAREVLIPIQCEYYALEGLSQLLRNIELIKGHLNPTLRVSTILLTMYDGRTRLSSQVADEVRAHFPTEVLRTTVPRSVRISEAPSHGQTVMTYDPASSGALSYLEAARELAEQVLEDGAPLDDELRPEEKA
jgi:chromosome partitioning protein